MLKRLGILLTVAASLLLAAPLSAEAPSWTSHGPYGGRIQALAASPDFAHDATLYAGSPSGQLLVSSDAGEAWAPVAGYGHAPVSSLALSPGYAEDDTLYVATTSAGVLRSPDRGETWTPWSAGLTNLSVKALCLSPAFASDQVALAATPDGVFRSTNGGKQWFQVGAAASALSLAVGPAGSGVDGRFVAFAGLASGMQRSLDGGETWEPVGPAGLPVTAVAVSPNYGSDSSVVAGTVAGVYTSETAGISWSPPKLAEHTIQALLYSPQFGTDGRLLAGAEAGLYLSTDRGANWGAVEQVVSSVLTLMAAGGRLYAGVDPEGVLSSPNGGDTWTTKNHGLADRAMRAVAVSPGFVHDVRAFAGGPSGLWRTEDDGRTWILTNLDFAEVQAIRCSPSFVENGRAYAATKGGVFVSIDEGQSWGPTAASLPVLEVNTVAVDEAERLWVGTANAGVFYSPDQGATWFARSSGLGNMQVKAIECLETVNGAPHLLAGTYGAGTFRSLDGGLSWHASEDSPDTPHILSLTRGRGFDGRLWSFAGTTAGVYRSGDKGVEWEYVGLIEWQIPALALHPNYADRTNVYLGGPQIGARLSTNGGISWQSLNAGLGDTRVEQVAVGLDPQSRTVIYAATGGGVWRHGGAPRDPGPHPSENLMLLPLVFVAASGG